MSIMGGVMSFASTCAGIVAGVRGFITTADLVKGGFDFEKVTGLNGGDYFSNKVSNSTKNNEVSWKRVTRNDGSFMGNYIPMDGTSGKQNGNNVDQFLYYSMHKLQKDNNVEITALLLQAEGSTDCSYLIMDWVTTGATADSGNMLPEVVPSNGKKAPYIMLNGVKHNVYAFLHTHPDKPAGTPDKGAPSNFDNAPSFYDAFFSCDWGGIPNYVLGVDFISRVSCKDAGGVELNTRPKDANNNPIDFVSDYYKIAEVYELNTGKFSFVRDVFPKFKRPIKGAK
jgi:cytochrome b involved in lipid metabolism